MLLAERRGAAVDQEDHRRLQTLGGMHGHDADLVAALVHLALDLGAGVFERRQEGLQPRQAGALLGQAEAQELVEDVAGLVAEPRDHLLAHAVAAEHRRSRTRTPA